MRERAGDTLSPSTTATVLTILFLVIGWGALASPGEPVASESGSSVMTIPAPVEEEHERLHAELEEAMAAGGRTGEAAKLVQRRLSDHFEEENELVMPLLGLLAPLAEEGASAEMRPAIAQSREVAEKLPRFLEEHRAIHRAVDRLEAAAEAEGKEAQAAFARRLRLHARTEEEVLYPTAILIGRYLESELPGR